MIGVVPIEPLQLGLATLFILVPGVLSLLLGLGLVRSFLVATIRTYVQLLALGIVLRWVFDVNTPWLVLAALLVMAAAAVQILTQRVRTRPPGVIGGAFAAMLVSCFTVTFAVTGLIVGVKPWHDAQYVLPIGGMVLGNSMTGISIALERLFSDLRSRAGEVSGLLALGASPREAARGCVRGALTAGMIPTINSMSAVGLVSIPGMMTGQVLAGADPQMAARYQIVVMLMIAGATAIGAMIAVFLTYRRAFDPEDRLILPTRAGDGRS